VEVGGSLTDSPARFAALELRVAADCSDPELLERLVGIADHGCIMMNPLRGTLDVTVSSAAGVAQT
jgi:hypothetical protein